MARSTLPQTIAMSRTIIGVILAWGLGLVSIFPLFAQNQITYIPPKQKQQRPRHTESSATRGCHQQLNNSVVLLAPVDHVGRTVSPRPRLFYYSDGKNEIPAIMTLAARDGRVALWEKEITLKQPGLNHVSLPSDLQLKIDQEYLWTVTILCNPVNLSQGIEKQVTIKRIPLSVALERQLATIPETEHSYLYALAGLWYDALSSLVSRSPQDLSLLKELLAQIGLLDIKLPSVIDENSQKFSR